MPIGSQPKGIKRKSLEEEGLIFSSDQDPLFEGFLDEIRSEPFRPRTDEDVEKVVSLETSLPPMTQLTKDELIRLKNYLREHANFAKRKINNSSEQFIEDSDSINELLKAVENYKGDEDFYDKNGYSYFMIDGSRNLWPRHDNEESYNIKTKKNLKTK